VLASDVPACVLALANGSLRMRPARACMAACSSIDDRRGSDPALPTPAVQAHHGDFMRLAATFDAQEFDQLKTLTQQAGRTADVVAG
jgi:hypothetical protein